MHRASTQPLKVNQSLDVRTLAVPADYLKAKECLEALGEDHVLELYIGDGEPMRRIPFGLRAEGYEILVSEPATNGVRLLVRKRASLRGEEGRAQ